jgi:hypothetical protein
VIVAGVNTAADLSLNFSFAHQRMNQIDVGWRLVRLRGTFALYGGQLDVENGGDGHPPIAVEATTPTPSLTK